MDGYLVLLKSLLCLSLLSCKDGVRGDFVLTVNFINYTNPTGLCAECAAPLSDVASADQLAAVCCDDLPLRNTNCDNTGEGRCDTRFRWTIRPFAALLETRPVTVENAINPPYFFTNCPISPSSVCPFPQVSTTFPQGPLGFLGVAANPLPVVSSTVWTGQTQFFIEAVDSGLPNIIDSLLINLDNLQLGADFTEEVTFTGYHDVSHMTVSFRVECSPGFCGPNCTTMNDTSLQIAECHTNGTIVCVPGWDPHKNCSECLNGRDSETNCTTCLSDFSGNPCVRETSSPAPAGGAIAGGVMGVLIAALIVGFIIGVVVCVVHRQQKSVTRSLAVNPRYESMDAINEQPLKTNTVGSTQEHDFDNPLYDTRKGDNDYSSPWDTRANGSTEPVMVSSTNSTHAVVMRVNSNEHKMKSATQQVEHATIDPQRVEYATIDPLPQRRHSYENTKIASSSSSHDYAEPPNALPPTVLQPVYDTPELPPTHTYEYAEVVTSQKPLTESDGGRAFDNTGEHGLYRSSSPIHLPPDAQLHYDLGQ